MTSHHYIYFNKSPQQLRLIGACGGRAFGRNQRRRRALRAGRREGVFVHNAHRIEMRRDSMRKNRGKPNA
jgi:hypothetical protein